MCPLSLLECLYFRHTARNKRVLHTGIFTFVDLEADGVVFLRTLSCLYMYSNAYLCSHLLFILPYFTDNHSLLFTAL